MRIDVLSLIGAACLAVAPAVDAKTHTPSTQFYVNVHGTMWDGSVGDQYLTFNRRCRCPKRPSRPAGTCSRRSGRTCSES